MFAVLISSEVFETSDNIVGYNRQTIVSLLTVQHLLYGVITSDKEKQGLVSRY